MSFRDLSPEKFAEIQAQARAAKLAKGIVSTRVPTTMYRKFCRRGHEMTEENRYTRTSIKTKKSGEKYEYTQVDCRMCMRLRDQRQQAKRRQRKFDK